MQMQTGALQITGPGPSRGEPRAARPDPAVRSRRRRPHPDGARHRLTRVHHRTRSPDRRELSGANLGRFISGAAATTSNIVVFEGNGYHGIDPETGRARWKLDPPKGVGGFASITSRDLYLVGGCPITSND
jgi:hypothetical protein